MLLPEGTEKRDFKLYEEVNIPPSDPIKLSLNHKLVPISALDEVRYAAGAQADHYNA